MDQMTGRVRCGATSTFISLLVILLALASIQPARAQGKDFSVPAQSATTGIPEFARQAGIQILVSEPLVRGKQISAVSGSHSVEEGLAILLKGTGLVATSKDGTTYTVVAASSAGALRNSTGKAVSQPESIAGPPNAEGSTTVEPATAGLAEILIQGSKILNLDVKRTEDDVQPYTIFDAETIQQSGAVNVEDFLKQQLTQNTVSMTNTQAAGTSIQSLGATSSIDLRGLGTNETLVLVDGRRMAAVQQSGGTTNNGGQPDINGIPLAAIERIEVLPSSASAIYGGSALGGVINIILKKNYQGGEFHYTYGNVTSGQVAQNNVGGSYGFSLPDDKTHVMVSANYADQQTLTVGDRLSLYERGISTGLTNCASCLYGTLLAPIGAGATNIAGIDAFFNPTNLILKNGTPLNSSRTFVPVGAAPGSNLSAGLLANAGRWDLNPGAGATDLGGQSAPLIAAPTVKSLMITLNRDLTSAVSVFVDFSTLSNYTSTISPPSYQLDSGVVPATAPDNPFQQTVEVSFPITLTTPEVTNSVTQRVSTGLVAHLPRNWSSEIDYTWSRNINDGSYYTGDTAAFGADLASGAINPFVDTLKNPLQLTPYLQGNSYAGNATLDDVNARASGPLGSFSWGDPTLTVGLEHRKEGFHSSDDTLVEPAIPANNVETIYNGQWEDTNSLYAEALIPLVTAKNAVPGVHGLELQLAGRSERFQVTSGPPCETIGNANSSSCQYLYSGASGLNELVSYSANNGTFGIKYKPLDELAIRTSYSTAFLPPTANQLLINPQPTPGVTIVDPKNGQSYDVTVIGTGNPNLQPQRARTWDLGAVWEPHERVLDGLRVDLEYYRIVQPNYIVSPYVQSVVDDSALASRVTRDPTTGLITTVDCSLINATEYKTNGYDLTVSYKRSTAYGVFGAWLAGTAIQHDLRQYSIGSPFLEYAGYADDGGEPKLKANLRLSWQYRQWSLYWTTVYFGSYPPPGTPGSPTYIQDGGPFSYYTDIQELQGGRIPAQVYHNISGVYNLDKIRIKGISSLSLNFGINNIFDTLPAYEALNNFHYAFSSAYGNVMLRQYTVGFRVAF
jgi:iron complex outermembrane receptor protein